MALFVEFQIANDGYLLAATQVVQVLPLVDIKRIPRAPAGVAGVINYHGESVPVVDLSELATGEPAARNLSTRLILVRYPDRTARERLLGVIAEKVTQTVRRESTDFVATGVASDAASYLGPVCTADGRLLQRVEVHKLLTADVSDVLFRQPEEDSWSSPESKHC
ncbi:chemotaxis protein CheW [Povalibacter sp.]|uniref:chemotaxis protein CheW n=1 Tax=Povalibacter sp. TaxID=1962978 RepID=UPI002F421D7A